MLNNNSPKHQVEAVIHNNPAFGIPTINPEQTTPVVVSPRNTSPVARIIPLEGIVVGGGEHTPPASQSCWTRRLKIYLCAGLGVSFLAATIIAVLVVETSNSSDSNSDNPPGNSTASTSPEPEISTEPTNPVVPSSAHSAEASATTTPASSESPTPSYSNSPSASATTSASGTPTTTSSNSPSPSVVAPFESVTLTNGRSTVILQANTESELITVSLDSSCLESSCQPNQVIQFEADFNGVQAWSGVHLASDLAPFFTVATEGGKITVTYDPSNGLTLAQIQDALNSLRGIPGADGCGSTSFKEYTLTAVTRDATLTSGGQNSYLSCPSRRLEKQENQNLHSSFAEPKVEKTGRRLKSAPSIAPHYNKNFQKQSHKEKQAQPSARQAMPPVKPQPKAKIHDYHPPRVLASSSSSKAPGMISGQASYAATVSSITYPNLRGSVMNNHQFLAGRALAGKDMGNNAGSLWEKSTAVESSPMMIVNFVLLLQVMWAAFHGDDSARAGKYIPSQGRNSFAPTERVYDADSRLNQLNDWSQYAKVLPSMSPADEENLNRIKANATPGREGRYLERLERMRAKQASNVRGAFYETSKQSKQPEASNMVPNAS